jgi:hypothetical protein
MNDLSHIGGPGASKERRIASARRRNIPSLLSASERGERAAEEYFRARGSAQVSEKARNGQGNPRKTGLFSWIVFAQAWPDLAEFG